MAVFTPRSRVTGLESDAVAQEPEPTPQALSDGILVVGISSKGQTRDFRRTNKIPPSLRTHILLMRAMFAFVQI